MSQWSKLLLAPVTLAVGLAASSTWYGCNEFEVKALPGFNKQVGDIILRKCTPCHAGGKSENGLGYIDKPELLVAKGYILPGDHANSLLFKKVSSTPPFGDRMPKGGPYLTEAQLAVVADWIDNMDDPAGTKYDVTVSASQGITTNPTGATAVGKNKTLAITVTAASGTEVSKTVGGTCPEGTWSDSIYTTGKITAACNVVFTKDNEAVVSASGTGVTLDSSSVTLEKGNTATFAVTVRANDSMTYDLTSISGTCPTGSWDTSATPKKYTTGAITSSCSVVFATQNPCATVDATASFAAVQTIMNNVGCAGCHDGSDSSKADFSSFATASDLLAVSLLTPTNAGKVLIDRTNGSSGVPLNSVLYLNVTSNLNRNGQMPQGGPYLSTAEQSKICNWILNGAN